MSQSDPKDIKKVDIFAYTCPATFLVDTFEMLNRKNRAYSMRAWALKLNFKHSSTLFRVLKKQRGIPHEYIGELCHFFNFSPAERAYFEILAVSAGNISSESVEVIRASLSKRTPW